jgi:predicted HicB family RNase H-like nuclease
MTLRLHLPPELEQRLIQEAKRQGLSLDAYTLKPLDTHLPPKDQRLGLVALLDTWIAEGDSEEQQEAVVEPVNRTPDTTRARVSRSLHWT